MSPFIMGSTMESRNYPIGAPTPTERSMRISRTTLFRTWFTAQRALSSSCKEEKA
jgi:hypothetical protein